MTSPRQVAANRANSRASTGPRSAAGKSRAAQNARRHGLSLPVRGDPKLAAEVEELALEITGVDAPPQVKVLAREIAEAQIDICRIRRARQNALNQAFEAPVLLPTNQRARLKQVKALIDVEDRLEVDMYVPWELRRQISQPTGMERYARVVSDLAGALRRMDHYERRALSRRKLAIAAFDAARTMAGNGDGTA
jgi:hypothetical protein